jgi:5-methylcytosine-specific restriction protein A
VKRNGHGRIQGRAGQALRKARLAREPLCRDCADNGLVTEATTPDHILPLALGGTDTDDNVRCLCDEHHRIRTAEQFGHNIKPTIGVDGWPIC